MARRLLFIAFIILFFISCGTSYTVVSTGVDLSEYKYCLSDVGDINGDAELSDIILEVENLYPKIFSIVTKEQARIIISGGDKVFVSEISVKSEKWEGGHSYITILFKDYSTGRLLAVIKSSGIGMSVYEDQQIALQYIKKELLYRFKKNHK